ncbi:MAG: LptF/LptG family permease, partial [Deltaproteobacteria bacterium]|nr:LptF/LptG family permease [Deltaproteobacteria bacterium]
MIIFRAIFLELIVPFSLTLVVMTSLSMMEKVYRLVTLVVNDRLNPGEVGLMLLYMLPQMFTITLPLAVVGAVFITVIRQSMDSEVVSLRATGRSLFKYAQPFLAFGLFITVLSATMTLWLGPLASRRYQELQVEMIRWRATEKIIPGVFNYDFGEKVIHVGERKEDGELNRILIADRKQGPAASIITAQQGVIMVDPGMRQVVFSLKEGAIYSPRGSGEEFRATQFETMRYVLDYAPAKKVTLSRQTSMSLKSLWAELTPLEPSYQRRVLEIELYKRITLPWACLAMALASIPMAVMDPRSGRGAGYL